MRSRLLMGELVSMPPSARFACVLMLVLIGGCGPRNVVVLRPDPRIVREMQAIPENDVRVLVEKNPIIDVHVHTFNARYLPIRGILLGKRDLYWGANLIPDRMAELVAQLIIIATDLEPIAGQPTPLAQPIDPATMLLQSEPATNSTTDPAALSNPAITGTWKVLTAVTPPERLKPMPGIRPFSDAVPAIADPELTAEEEAALASFGLGDFRRFVRTLKTIDSQLQQKYLSVYGDQVRLLVSHSMDLAPVYNQRPSPETLLDFRTQQLPRYQHFQRQADSRMVWFVAYSPFRDHWPNGAAESEPLDIVKDAIDHYGAMGVKVYPPSGYRPTGNIIPPRPTGFDAQASPEPNRQWEARYRNVTPKQLDQRLGELLAYCETNDIPVFAHSGDGEFQARDGYGALMPDPVYWKKYLDEHSSDKTAHPDGGPCKLRLCFAHAGGEYFWFGIRNPAHPNHEKWGETIVQLCEKYPNVYCEIGVLAAIVDSERQAYFVGHLLELFQEHPTLKRKIMYGTDWCMPTAIAADRAYLMAYQRAFAHPGLRDNFDDFFFRNAVNYLNLPTHRTNQPDSTSKLPVETRQRIDKFLLEAPPE